MRYLLLATAFNGEASLMTEGQRAWKNSGKDFKKVLGKYSRASNKQESTNLLTTPNPEYFNDVNLVKSQRAESLVRGYMGRLELLDDLPEGRPHVADRDERDTLRFETGGNHDSRCLRFPQLVSQL